MRDSKRKSVKLLTWEKEELQKIRDTFNTAIECADFIGLKRCTFDRIFSIGQGSPESIEKIRLVINN